MFTANESYRLDLLLSQYLRAKPATVYRIACLPGGSVGESDKTGWFGGRTHDANTVYGNPDGSTSIEIETTTAKGNITTIVRERTTLAPDGKVRTDRETHTIVECSGNVVHETVANN